MLTNQAIRRLVPRLAAYLPNTLTRQILQQGLPPPGQAQWLMVATIFTDMSGFTTMTEELAADGPRGAEELNRTLLMTFTPLINAIHTAGGTVCHFHGDAMTLFFADDDGQAASRALACARFLQSLMQARSRVDIRRDSGQKLSFDLTLRIGVGYGRCLAVIVGDPAGSLEFVLAGTAVDEAFAAQSQAKASQVIASQAVLQKAGWPADTPFREVTEIFPVPITNSGIYWDAHAPEQLNRLAAIAPTFVHPNLYERLQDSNFQYVAEHRPITSLFVRFEGIDYDAADAGEKLQNYYQWARKIIARYGDDNCRLNRLLTGDKGSQLHILFGAPVAPDTPEQALRCALALQQEKPSFITRQQIGVAAGRGFACAVGSQNRREYTAVGRVVNLSARLAQLCPDNGVLTDETTARRTQKVIEFEVLPSATIKGFQQPIPLYLATYEQAPRLHLQTRFERHEPPPGREQEMGRLLARLAEAQQGQGGLIALSGELGSGQSQLLSVAVHTWLEAGGTGYMGVGQLQQHDVSFALWHTVWRGFFGLAPDMSLLAQMTAVAERLQTLSPDTREEEVRLWGDILGLSQQFGHPPAEVGHTRFFELVRHYLHLAAAQSPVLIVLEDIHLADQFSLDLLDQVTQSVKRQPILLLVTFRPSSTFAFRTLQRSICTHIELNDLSPEQARAVVKQMVGTDELPLTLEQRLGIRDRDDRTSPVSPLFLVESLKLMQTQGVLTINEDDHLHVDEEKLAELQVPDTTYAFSLAQLDHLSAAARSLLQTAAVIGREFDLPTLIAVTPGLVAETAIDLLTASQRVGLIRLLTQEPQPTYLFQRALTHNTVYQSLPYARRQTLHAAIADWLILAHADNLLPHYPVLAYHYSQTDRHEDGIRFALLAAQEAAARYANKEATRLYNLVLAHIAALGEVTQWQTAVTAHSHRAQSLRLLGEFSQAMAAATEALKLALLHGSATETLPLYNLLAEIRYAQARYQDVQELTSHVLNSPTNRDPDLLARAYVLAGLAANGLLDHGQALAHLEKAKKVCEQVQNEHRLVNVQTALALIHHDQAQLDTALTAALQAAEQGRGSSRPVTLSLALLVLSQVYLRLGQPEEALTAVNEAIHVVQTISRNVMARLLLQRTAVTLYTGQLSTAYSDLRDAARLLDGMDDPQAMIQLYLLLQEFYRERGELAQAQVYLGRINQLLTRQTAEKATITEPQIRFWLATAQITHQLQRLEQTKSLAHLALQSCLAGNLLWWLPQAHYWLGLAELDQNEVVANTHFQNALKAVERGGNPDMLPLISLQLALLESDMERQERYLVACVKAANVRAAYRERIACFRIAGPLLTASTQTVLHQMGERCQHLVAWFDAEVVATA